MALEAAERGISLLEDFPNIEDQMDTLRQRLMNLLVRQKEIIERFNQMKPKDWNKIESEEEALIKEAEQTGLIKMEKETDSQSAIRLKNAFTG